MRFKGRQDNRVSKQHLNGLGSERRSVAGHGPNQVPGTAQCAALVLHQVPLVAFEQKIHPPVGKCPLDALRHVSNKNTKSERP